MFCCVPLCSVVFCCVLKHITLHPSGIPAYTDSVRRRPGTGLPTGRRARTGPARTCWRTTRGITCLFHLPITCHLPPTPPSCSSVTCLQHLSPQSYHLSPARWLNVGRGERGVLQQFHNCEFRRLLEPRPGATAPTTVLSRIPIPLLHCILLNPGNHLLRHLGSRYLYSLFLSPHLSSYFLLSFLLLSLLFSFLSRWPLLDTFFADIIVIKAGYHGETFEGKCATIIGRETNQRPQIQNSLQETSSVKYSRSWSCWRRGCRRSTGLTWWP